MKTNLKIGMLIGSCVVIVGMLSFIQYYLVDNTYQLTKEKYYAEVSQGVGKIMKVAASELAEDKAQENLKQTAQVYVSKKLTKAGFLALFKSKNDSTLHDLAKGLRRQFDQREELKNVAYKSQYDQIILTYSKKTDTILYKKKKAVVIWGKSFSTENAILFSSGSNKVNIGQTGPNDLNSITLQVNRSQYIDVSSWKQEVYKRMAGIYLLAVLLIIAVILLFYLVFSAMIKQKKLAGIKTDFANNITHELKTPLSSVSLILQTLAKKEVQADPLRTAELLATLNRQHLKILQTVDFVLESAMEADLTAQKEKIEITGYLDEFVSEIIIQGHTLKSEIDPLKQHILTNVQLLDKIMNNLIENAAKYSPEGSVIKLNAFRSHNEYHIEISDQGMGISSRDKKHIFDKFYRVTEYNKHTVKGLGLGLYLSKKAASMLGGELELKSSTATGSVFVLKLPLL